jgi:AcrR family transcriptional regulator
VFKLKKRSGTKGAATRKELLAAALELFRRRGYERTTMRAIAQHAGLSLGAAYHYFDSKDAILTTYYEWLQDEHERAMARVAVPGSALRERLLALFEAKLAVVRKDRRLLAALFARIGDPTDPLSVFGKRHAALRERSIVQFANALSDVPLSADVRSLAGRTLWLAHLGVLLFFVHDRSPRQAKTHALAEVLVDLAVGALPFIGHPHAAALRNRLLELSSELVPGSRFVS